MRSWMSIAAVTAASAEPNSASIASPVPWTIEPPAISTAGRQTSLFTDLRFREGELLLAFGQADEAGEVGVKNRGQVASRRVRDIHCDPGNQIRLEAKRRSSP